MQSLRKCPIVITLQIKALAKGLLYLRFGLLFQAVFSIGIILVLAASGLPITSFIQLILWRMKLF